MLLDPAGPPFPAFPPEPHQRAGEVAAALPLAFAAERQYRYPVMSGLVSIVEPSGDVYRALLAFAEKSGSLFSLVWRDQFDFAEPAYAVDQALASDSFPARLRTLRRGPVSWATRRP